MLFRGREMAHVDLAQKSMKTVLERLADVAKVEMPAKMAGKRMSMVLMPHRGMPLPHAPTPGDAEAPREQTQQQP